MTAELVTLPRAKQHLRITDDLQDDDIQMKVQQASGIVLQYMKLKAVPAEWFTGSPLTIDAPSNIQGYTLLILSELFENRESSTFSIQNILSMIPRDPTFA